MRFFFFFFFSSVSASASSGRLVRLVGAKRDVPKHRKQARAPRELEHWRCACNQARNVGSFVGFVMATRLVCLGLVALVAGRDFSVPLVINGEQKHLNYGANDDFETVALRA